MTEKKYYVLSIYMIIISFLFTSYIYSEIYRYSILPENFLLLQSSLFFLLLLLTLILIINKVETIYNNTLAIILLLFGFVIKSLVAIININYKILPNLSDVAYYNELGLDFSRDLAIQGGVIGAPLYGNIIGAVYYFLGASSVNICLINVFIYSISSIVLVKICEMFKFDNYNIVLFLLIILPSSFLYIPVILRESIFLLLSIIFIYLLINQFSNNSNYNNINHIYLFILLILVTLVRPQIFPILLLIYLVCLIYYKGGLIRLVSILLFLSLVLIISLSNFTLFQFVSTDLLNLQYFQIYRNAFSDLPNAYLINISYHDWFDFLSYLPTFIFYFLFAPFPWIANNYNYFMATVDSLFSMLIVIFSILVLIDNRIRWKSHMFPIILCILAFLIPFSMIEASPTGAVRHRMLVILFLLPIFSNCMTFFKIKSKK